MGKPAPTGIDLACTIVSGAFTATGQSGLGVSGQGPNVGLPCLNEFFDTFNMALYGTFVGTVAFERSFDGGTTYSALSEDASGTTATYTVPVNATCYEPERGVLYRWNCTAYTSGTINYRISQSSNFIAVAQ